MHLEAQAVAGPVEESHRAALAVARFVTGLLETGGHGAMHVAAIRPRADRLDRPLLRLAHGGNHPALHLARASLEIGAGHVAEIPGLLHPGKDIDDDEFVRAQWSRAALMRV